MTADNSRGRIPIDVLVIGGGMYVTGRGAENTAGTIMPALLEARRAGRVGRLALVTTNAASADEARQRTQAIAKSMGIDDQCDAYPGETGGGEDLAATVRDFAPDATVISVPDHLHAACSIPLLDAGVHCLVVKPLAGSLADARAMGVAASAAGVVAQVEFHKRLDESNLLMRDAVSSRRLGDLLYATVEYSQRKTIPRDVFRGWAEDSNIFQYLGVHYVDLLLWITGFAPKRVTAWGQKGYLLGLGIDTWDAMQVVIEWDRGDGGAFVSTHVTNWVDPDESSAMSDQKITVVGTEGRYQADQKHRGIQMLVDGGGVEDLNPYFTASWSDDVTGHRRYNGYGIKSVHQFITDVAAVRDGRISVGGLETSRPSFAAGLISTAVVEAARKSLKNGSVPEEMPV